MRRIIFTVSICVALGKKTTARGSLSNAARVSQQSASVLCGKDLEVTWFKNLSFSLGSSCSLPSASEFADDLLVNRHVHVSGDSTLRMPVQHFEAEWEECAMSKGKYTRSTRPNVVALDHQYCSLYYVPFKKQYPSWMKTPLSHPLGRFALSMEFTTYIPDQQATSKWWRLWVDGFSSCPASEREPLRDGKISDSDRMTRLPDAVILGSWAWHGVFWKGEKDTAVFLRNYESELRAFLSKLVAHSSYADWWSHGRLYWRMALPSRGCPEGMPTCFDGQDSVEACNGIAARVLTELAPGVVQINQAAILGRANADVQIAYDDLHFFHPIQDVIMRHLLSIVLLHIRRQERSGDEAAEISAVSNTPTISSTRSASASLQPTKSSVPSASASTTQRTPAASSSPVSEDGEDGTGESDAPELENLLPLLSQSPYLRQSATNFASVHPFVRSGSRTRTGSPIQSFRPSRVSTSPSRTASRLASVSSSASASSTESEWPQSTSSSVSASISARESTSNSASNSASSSVALSCSASPALPVAADSKTPPKPALKKNTEEALQPALPVQGSDDGGDENSAHSSLQQASGGVTESSGQGVHGILVSGSGAELLFGGSSAFSASLLAMGSVCTLFFVFFILYLCVASCCDPPASATPRRATRQTSPSHTRRNPASNEVALRGEKATASQESTRQLPVLRRHVVGESQEDEA